MAENPADKSRGSQESVLNSEPPPSAQLAHPQYRADIDGLRAVAVLSVVVFHAFPKILAGGFVGVDIFFVISGFLISTIILGNLAQGTFTYWEFYRRRIRRIFPALIVVSLGALAAGWFVLQAGDYAELGKHALAGTGFVSNLLLWSEAGYFDTSADSKPLLHLWSLAIEEQFYILWPLVLVVVWKRRWSLLAIACALALGSFAVNLLTVHVHPVAAFYSPLSRFWELMIGGLLAYLTLHRPSALSRLQNFQSTCGVALVALSLVLVNHERPFPSWWALMPTFGAALLISAGPQAWFNRLVLANRVAVWFGQISYPLYLWHWPILALTLALNNFAFLPAPVRAAAVLVSIALAWLTYKYVEGPIRRSGRVSSGRLVAGFCSAGLAGATIMLLAGLPLRSANQDEAKLFLAAYGKLHRYGLSEYYQEKCDFYDWSNGRNKGAVDKTCTADDGVRPVYLLWGDSHAQALSYGMRQNISSQVQLAHIATSGCRPSLREEVPGGINRSSCVASNKLAREFIRDHRPARVFVAQGESHELTEWADLAEFVRANDGELVLIGPTPQWTPSLPIVVAKDLRAPRDFVADGLDDKLLVTDAYLRNKYGSGPVRYVSIIGALCRERTCLASVETKEPLNLLVLDRGHLTPAGSNFVASTILKEVLQPLKSARPKSTSAELAPK